MKTGDVRACVMVDEMLPADGFEAGRGEGEGAVGLGGLATTRTVRDPSVSPSSPLLSMTPTGGSSPGGDDEILQAEDGSESSHAVQLASSPPFSVSRQRGWVTLVKEGRKLVTSRVRLHAGQRQAHMGQWQRRVTNDKLLKDVKLELATDPTGIGFAYGGIEPVRSSQTRTNRTIASAPIQMLACLQPFILILPALVCIQGVLHSKGAVHELHRVSYSIGLVGRYHLHVRLRQAALPVPGSPFTLIVKPGKASATSTRIPAGISQMHPLRGKVTILWVASEQCVQCSSP